VVSNKFQLLYVMPWGLGLICGGVLDEGGYRVVEDRLVVDVLVK